MDAKRAQELLEVSLIYAMANTDDLNEAFADTSVEEDTGTSMLFANSRYIAPVDTGELAVMLSIVSETPVDNTREHPEFTVEMWQREVAEQKTVMSYSEWRQLQDRLQNYPDYPPIRWREEVAGGKTKEGYIDWVRRSVYEAS